MKLLLIQPPIRDFYDTPIRIQPLGLCMLKAALGKFMPHIRVAIKDYHQGYGRKSVPLPLELSYLKAYYRHPDMSPFRIFYHYYHFGASFEDIGWDVFRENPDLVGISCLFSPYYLESLACAREIKRHLSIPVLMGGAHVSAAPLTVLNDSNVDFIIRGEGERALVEFLKAYTKGSGFEKVPNLGFKQDGHPVLNPLEENFPLNELPFADLSDLPVNRYLFEEKPLTFLTTSRGCPHRCDFCSVHLTFGEGYRTRQPECVFSELRYRYDEGYRVFDFEDDNLSFCKEDFKTLLNLIIHHFPANDIRLAAMNGISYLGLDRETIEIMKRAGFQQLNISLVSVNGGSLLRLHRPHTVSKYLEVVDYAHSLDFDIVSYQILGLPHETLDDMTDTLAFMARLPVRIGASIFYLTPGCQMTKAHPPLTRSDILRSRSTAMAIETESFCRDDLYTLFITARIINFIKSMTFACAEVTFQQALHHVRENGRRNEMAAELLTRLFDEKRLYAATRQGLRPLPGFKSSLFFTVWEKAGEIRTRSDTTVSFL